MLRLLAVILIFWEPLHFAAELLGVFPTIAYRGVLAVVELVAHGLVAAVSAAAGFALLNRVPDGRRLAAFAVVAVAGRTIQSLYLSVLPNNTPPGTAPLYVGAVIVVAAIGMVIVRSRPT